METTRELSVVPPQGMMTRMGMINLYRRCSNRIRKGTGEGTSQFY